MSWGNTKIKSEIFYSSHVCQLKVDSTNKLEYEFPLSNCVFSKRFSCVLATPWNSDPPEAGEVLVGDGGGVDAEALEALGGARVLPHRVRLDLGREARQEGAPLEQFVPVTQCLSCV